MLKDDFDRLCGEKKKNIDSAARLSARKELREFERKAIEGLKTRWLLSLIILYSIIFSKV